MRENLRRLQKRTGVTLLALLLFHVTGLASGVEVEPSEFLGELRLDHALRGEKALQAIDRLHGKEVAGKDSFVAHYEKDGVAAMLYVSKASSAGEAVRQLERMTERIQQGNTPFYHLKASDREGTTVYSALGQGQIHYFFRKGIKVIWLAVDAPVAQQTLDDLFDQNQ